MVGLNTIPRCRYGENRCYYRTPESKCDFTSAHCSTDNLVNMRVEGSGDNSMEQFAIPVVAALVSLVSPVLVFVGVLLSKQFGTLETVCDAAPRTQG